MFGKDFKRTGAALMAAGMLMMSSGSAFAQTFSAATRAVGAGASVLGGIVKTDYHPENMYIPGYWSNGSGAGGTSGGATEANQGNVGETGGTVSAQQTYTQTAGGSVLKAVGETQLTYGNASSIASYGSGPDSGDGGKSLIQTGASYAVDYAIGSSMGLAGTATGELAMSAGTALMGEAAAASVVPVIGWVIAVVSIVMAVFDMFGGGIEYSWSGSCAARTGSPCNGWYESNGYTHIGYGLYVPSTTTSKIQNDVSMQSLGDSMSQVLTDKNADPNAIFDSSGRKLKGSYGVYLGQGNALLQGFHPIKDSVLISDTRQTVPNGWQEETVYKGVENVAMFMYTYAPQAAWNGTN